MVVLVVVDAEAQTERSNASVSAASHIAALHRVDVVVAAPMLFAVTRGAAAHIVDDPAISATSNPTS